MLFKLHLWLCTCMPTVYKLLHTLFEWGITFVPLPQALVTAECNVVDHMTVRLDWSFGDQVLMFRSFIIYLVRKLNQFRRSNYFIAALVRRRLNDAWFHRVSIVKAPSFLRIKYKGCRFIHFKQRVHTWKMNEIDVWVLEQVTSNYRILHDLLAEVHFVERLNVDLVKRWWIGIADFVLFLEFLNAPLVGIYIDDDIPWNTVRRSLSFFSGPLTFASPWKWTVNDKPENNNYWCLS